MKKKKTILGSEYVYSAKKISILHLVLPSLFFQIHIVYDGILIPTLLTLNHFAESYTSGRVLV